MNRKYHQANQECHQCKAKRLAEVALREQEDREWKQEAHDITSKFTERNPMRSAITALEIHLSVLEENEPINRDMGNTKQADLEAMSAAEVRQALAVLRAADAGPIRKE
jgi:hypothetical protein